MEEALNKAGKEKNEELARVLEELKSQNLIQNKVSKLKINFEKQFKKKIRVFGNLAIYDFRKRNRSFVIIPDFQLRFIFFFFRPYMNR